MAFTQCFDAHHAGNVTAAQVILPVLAELDRVFGEHARNITIAKDGYSLTFESIQLGANRVAHVPLQSPSMADFAMSFATGDVFDMTVVRSYPERPRRCCGLLAPATTTTTFHERNLAMVIGKPM
jgi:hypothetical protein